MDYHCDIDYDVFKFMRDNGKKYGKWNDRNHSQTVSLTWALHSRLQHCIPRVPCYRAYAMEYSARVQTHAPRSDEAFSRNQRLAVAVCHG